VVGGIAERIGAWESAVSAFSAAALRAPDRTGLRGRWGTSLFEQGFRNEALAVLTDTAAVGGKDGQTRLALAVVLARMARWPEAAAVFRSQAVDLGVPSLLGPDRARVITVSLDSLLPPGNGQQLEKLAAFEMVGVMEEMGWRVYHPGTTIGRTVVVTPVDIVAVSGGGTSAPDESIRIGASQISRHLRGYNMVVLDPVSGAVTRELNYDTWRNQADCQRLAAELNSLERGAIVVGVVHEPGTKELTASARLAMERLGLSAIPGDGWSHAFVGVQGAEKGTALEAKAKSARAVVGALRANIDGELARDPGRLAQYLVEQAAQAEGGVAVYVAESGGRASFVVARAR
jgi:hypothetical protein